MCKNALYLYPKCDFASMTMASFAELSPLILLIAVLIDLIVFTFSLRFRVLNASETRGLDASCSRGYAAAAETDFPGLLA
jgi:hypothetical protein